MELLLKNINGIETLIRENGQPTVCPYQTKLLVPGQMAGTAQVLQQPCSELCPFFRVVKSGEKDGLFTVYLCHAAIVTAKREIKEKTNKILSI